MLSRNSDALKAERAQKKENYQKQLDEILAVVKRELAGAHKKQTLLLHACCGPCSSYVIEYLAPYFDITIYYYNPNIFPPQEYRRRLEELKFFLTDFDVSILEKVKLIEGAYNPEDFYTATNTRREIELQTEAERGERCRRCYDLRMAAAYRFAAENCYDWFTTTLSISPFKDAEKINAIGRTLTADYAAETGFLGPKFLTSDFKKRGGFKRSLELSSEHNLYRQDYCGCEYSYKNTAREKAQKVAQRAACLRPTVFDQSVPSEICHEI